jgi:hypothetical protein
MATFDFCQGKEIEFSYPVSTHVRFFRPDQYRDRQIVVHDVRDLVTDPLTLEEFSRRPWLMRSRYLVRAYEPDRGKWRQFYVGSSRQWQSPGMLRVGLYEHGATRPDRIFGRAFAPTIEDRRVMIAAIREWSKHHFVCGSLRVFVDDLGLCG